MEIDNTIAQANYHLLSSILLMKVSFDSRWMNNFEFILSGRGGQGGGAYNERRSEREREKAKT